MNQHLLRLVLLLIPASLLWAGFQPHKKPQDKERTSSYTLYDVGTPQKTPLVINNLPLHIPGKDELKKPFEFTREINTIKYTPEAKITPGESYLPQSADEIAAGKRPIRTQSPVITKLTSPLGHRKNAITGPDVIPLNEPVKIPYENIKNYDHLTEVIQNILIQGGDTIFPPVITSIPIPDAITALPFKFKDNAVTNISFGDAAEHLPNSFIRDVSADSNGTLWIGSHTGGVIEYDGENYHQYTEKQGLSDDMVYTVEHDNDGRVWVGTVNTGINIIDGNTITYLNLKQGLPDNLILDIFKDSHGNMWVATKKGVIRIDNKDMTHFTRRQGLVCDTVMSIGEDLKGNMWFGTEKGLSRWDGKDFYNFTSSDGLPRDFILSMTCDQEGTMWFGSYGGGLTRYNGSTFETWGYEQGLLEPTILDIKEDANNNLWIGTFGGGLVRFYNNSFKYLTTEDGLNDDYVRSLFVDPDNNLWIGTDGNGIAFLQTNSFNYITTQEGLPDNLVLSIYEDDQSRLWFGTFEGGVVIVDDHGFPEKNSMLKHFSNNIGDNGDIITSITQDNNDDYWLGTYGKGIIHVNKEELSSDKIKMKGFGVAQGLPDDVIRSIVNDQKGNLWFATEEGVSIFDGVGFRTINTDNGLNNNLVVALYRDREGAIWIGTLEGGVSRYFNDTLTTYTTTNGLCNNSIWTITEDNNGLIWFGSDGSGLSAFDGKHFRTVDLQDGLVNRYVFSLLSDPQNNTLWVGTIRGLSRIHFLYPNDKKDPLDFNPIFRNFTTNDGLKSIDFYTNSCLKDFSNRLWWGTNMALTWKNLNNTNQKEIKIYLQIKDIIVNTQPIRYKDKNLSGNKDDLQYQFDSLSSSTKLPVNLSLPSDMNNIIFSFSGSMWQSPGKLEYEYQLLGYDDYWATPIELKAEYNNLSPGKYTFLLRARIKGGDWEAPLSYSFTIRDPWYLMWYAYIGYLLLFILITFILIKWRIKQVQKQKDALAIMVKHRTHELNNALIAARQATLAKSQFIATMSHEIRTPLNAIIGLTHLTQNTPLSEKQDDYVQKIDRSAHTLMALINNILDFSKIEAGKMEIEAVNFNLEMVLNSVLILNSQKAQEKGLLFTVQIDPKLPRLLIGDPLRITQVISNLCHNAIKFTEKGYVLIDVNRVDSELEDTFYLSVHVRDTGIGIDPNQLPQLFSEFRQADNTITRQYGGTGLGLSISSHLVTLMQGEIMVESRVGQGSDFSFTCLLKEQNNTSSSIEVPEKITGLTILVAESDPHKSKAIMSSLAFYGISSVFHCNTADDVIKMVAIRNVDLLIIGTKLKGQTGIDTMLKVREMNHHLSFILIAESEQETETLTNSILGINATLSQPFLPSVLYEKIQTIYGFSSDEINEVELKHSVTEEMRSQLKGKHVLLAEDNEVNRQVVYELLMSMGVNAKIATNGGQAVELVNKESFDLILMDLHMPVMDGYETTRILRNMPITIPIIAITADTLDTIKEKCQRVGFNGIITKPIDPDLFYNQISLWLGLNYAQKQTVTSNSQELLFEVDEINIEESVKRFANNESLLIRMLQKFSQTHNETCKNLESLINIGDYEEAHLLIHSLKGETANLGLKNLSGLCSHVEKLIIDRNHNALFEIIGSLQDRMNETIDKIIKAYPVKRAELFDNVSLKQHLDKLYEALQKSHPAALDIMDLLKVRTSEAHRFNAIEELMKKGDRIGALELIDLWRKGIA